MPNLRPRVALLAAVSAISMSAAAPDLDQVQAPAFKAGDTWLYDQVVEKGPAGFDERRLSLAVEEVGDGTMTVGIKRDGAPTALEAHVVGTDWSQRRLVAGQEAMTTRPFAFPMSIGRRWSVDFIDTTRRGNQLSNHVRMTYTVVGWEDVDVPAGHFRALKVESRGVDEGMHEFPKVAGAAVIASPGNSTGVSHVQQGGVSQVVTATHDELYYVPAIKSYVKSIEEQYNTDNVRVWRQSRSLVSFTPGT